MTKKTRDGSNDLFLHVVVRDGSRTTPDGIENGAILLKAGGSPLVQSFESHQDVISAIEKLSAADTRVHALGSWRTSQLIQALMSDPGIGLSLWREKRLFIGSSPMVDYQSSVPKIFEDMRTCRLSGSTGGWHAASSADLAVYRLISGVVAELPDPGDQASVDQLMPLLRDHPAWPAISFIPTAHYGCAMKLLAVIVDPRWHINPEKPDSRQSLYRFLGRSHLEEHGMRLWAQESPFIEVGTDTSSRRAALWLMSWSNGELYGRFNGVAEGVHPRDYLRRFPFYDASLRFASFLHSVWLAGMLSRELFVPEYFFRDSVVADTYRRHIRSLETNLTTDHRG